MTKMLLALVLAMTSCTTAPPSRPPDARPCDIVSCAAGAAFDCCPELTPPTTSTTRTAVVSAMSGTSAIGWSADFTGIGGSSRGCMRANGFDIRLAVPMPLVEGDRLLSLTIAIRGDGSSDVSVESFSAAPDGSLTLGVVGSMFVPNIPGDWHDYTIDLLDTVVSGGVSHWFEVVTDQPGICVGAFRLTYDRPSA